MKNYIDKYNFFPVEVGIEIEDKDGLTIEDKKVYGQLWINAISNAGNIMDHF